MHTYMDLCLAHPLETWTPFDIVVNSAYALLTMPVTHKPTNVVNSSFIRYSGTSAYIPLISSWSMSNGTFDGYVWSPAPDICWWIADALRAQCLGRLVLLTYSTGFREEESEVCCSSLRVEMAISEETFRIRLDDRLEIYFRYYVSKLTIPT